MSPDLMFRVWHDPSYEPVFDGDLPFEEYVVHTPRARPRARPQVTPRTKPQAESVFGGTLPFEECVPKPTAKPGYYDDGRPRSWDAFVEVEPRLAAISAHVGKARLAMPKRDWEGCKERMRAEIKESMSSLVGPEADSPLMRSQDTCDLAYKYIDISFDI